MDSAFGLDDLSSMGKAAERATELEPATSSWRGLALLLLGITQKLQGDFNGARQSLKTAIRLSGPETTTVASAFAYLALIYFREGDNAEALEHARRAQAVVERNGLRDSIPSIATHAVLAHLLSRRGDLVGAAHACERVNELLPLSDAYWWQSLEARLLTAPALLALGREDDAATHLRASEALLALHTDAGTMAIRFRETSRTLQLPSHRRVQSPEALSDAERRILRLLSSDLTLREIGRELLVSLNTVKTHKRSIYRKLGVSSRKAAVMTARINHAAHHDSPG
jgi:LuxR family maltose regulon positive regulatory protein